MQRDGARPRLTRVRRQTRPHAPASSAALPATAALLPAPLVAAQERAKYPAANLELGPTFVHRNLRDDPLVDEKGYPSYNKPYSVLAWLETRPPLPDGEDEFVLV